MAVRAILFDLFDTLVDLHMEELPETTVLGQRVRSTYTWLHEVVARESGIDLDTFARELSLVDRERRESHYRQGRELPTRERFGELVRRLGLADDGLADELTRVHMQRIRGVARYLPHHPELLAGLRGRHRLGICSNFSHTPTALEVLEEAGLTPHLDAIAISEQVGFRKPRPEIFEHALRLLDCAPEETLHVGDQLEADVVGAAALGIRPVWIVRRAPEAEAQLAAHQGAPPAAVISDLAELPALLERL